MVGFFVMVTMGDDQFAHPLIWISLSLSTEVSSSPLSTSMISSSPIVTTTTFSTSAEIFR